MLVSIREATYEGGHRIKLVFDNGEQGTVDLEDLVQKYPIAAPLRDPKAFAEFRLDEWPTLCWDCGFDVSPETLFERATGKRIQWDVRDSA